MDAVAWDEVSFEMDLYDKEAKSTKCFEGELLATAAGGPREGSSMRGRCAVWPRWRAATCVCTKARGMPGIAPGHP